MTDASPDDAMTMGAHSGAAPQCSKLSGCDEQAVLTAAAYAPTYHRSADSRVSTCVTTSRVSASRPPSLPLAPPPKGWRSGEAAGDPRKAGAPAPAAAPPPAAVAAGSSVVSARATTACTAESDASARAQRWTHAIARDATAVLRSFA